MLPHISQRTRLILVAICFMIFIYYCFTYTTEYDLTAPFSFTNPKLRQSTKPEIVGYFAPTSSTLDNQRRNRSKSDKDENNDDDSIYILAWTEVFGIPWAEQRLDTCFQHLPANSRRPKCRIVNNRKYLNRSSALIFHARDIYHTDLPAVKYRHQKYVFYSQESPVLTYAALRGASRLFFDWTMTYRTDSHIYCPYHYFQRKNAKDPDDSLLIERLTTNKTKSILWIVSNCDTHSNRARYVYELQKYVPVDIFGGCGRPCEESSTGSCDAALLDAYKFYISFENAVCPDYISEKFGQRMESGLVPIVLKREDYDRLVLSSGGESTSGKNRSEYWFIAADDFQSPKDLADYLVYLDRYPNEYAKYHEWRRKWRVASHSDRHCLCGLCSKLYDERERYRELARNNDLVKMAQLTKEEEETEFDIYNYWSEGTCDRNYALKLMERGRQRRFG